MTINTPANPRETREPRERRDRDHRGPRRDRDREQVENEFVEKIIAVNRVSKTVKGGRNAGRP